MYVTSFAFRNVSLDQLNLVILFKHSNEPKKTVFDTFHRYNYLFVV